MISLLNAVSKHGEQSFMGFPVIDLRGRFSLHGLKTLSPVLFTSSSDTRGQPVIFSSRKHPNSSKTDYTSYDDGNRICTVITDRFTLHTKRIVCCPADAFAETDLSTISDSFEIAN